MDDDLALLDADSPETRTQREDWHRRNMEDIRTSVTRGAGGIEASYFADQNLLLSHAGTSDDWEVH